MAVKHRGHLEPGQRIFQSTRSEKWKDLGRLAFHRGTDRRVVQQRDAMLHRQSGQRRLELERLLHRLVHEVLDDLLTPRPERASSESTAEAAYAGEADAMKFPGVAIEHVHADVAQHLRDVALLIRLEVVIPEHADHR